MRTVTNSPRLTSRVLHRPALAECAAGEDGEGAVIVDGGAHVGETALAFAAEFPRACIHAFEPIHRIYRALQANCRLHPQIQCHPLGLASVSERRTIALLSARADCTMNQVSALAGDHTAPELREAVNLVRLDDFCQQQRLTGLIAILKLDVEGYELEALRGAENLLQSRRICHVLAETTLAAASRQHVPYPELAAYLAAFGYRCTGFYDSAFRADNAELSFTNALFKRAAAR